jgi:hypothetical protein
MEKHGAPMSDVNLASLDILGRAQALVQTLLSNGHTHASIADALGGRVTARTVYRWAKGEHAPQKQGDLVALEKLVAVAASESPA